jgi:hypothetical protein
MDVIQLWWLSLTIFAVVVVVVAALLGSIVAAAKRIDRHAEAIWTVGKQIAGNTVSIWLLEQTNERVEKLVEETRAIGRVAEAIEARLGGDGEKPGGRRWWNRFIG